jgi:hypothetical protein
MHTLLDQACDVLLVDEATSVADSMLEALTLVEGKNAATTIVFAGLPSCINRLAFLNLHPAIIELSILSPCDARSYLLEQAMSVGCPDLFTAQALNLIVNESHGSFGRLRSIASFAFFRAALDRATSVRTERRVVIALAELNSMPDYLGPRDGSGTVTPDLLVRGTYPGDTVGPDTRSSPSSPMRASDWTPTQKKHPTAKRATRVTVADRIRVRRS